MKIQIKVLNKEFYSDRLLPSYATSGSAGIDLVCTEDVTIYPGETKVIPTGLAIWIGSNERLAGWLDESVVGLIVPRSGLGTRGLILANTIGVIDEDYQGELKIAAWNRNEFDFSPVDKSINLKAGDRVAQLMFVPILKPEWEVVEEFSKNTERGTGSFGSTGG